MDKLTLWFGGASGEPFTLGEVRCLSACKVCFSSDAKTDGGVVHRFDVDDNGQRVRQSKVTLETVIGLPPRYIGGF